MPVAEDEKSVPQDVSISPEAPSLDGELFKQRGVDEAGRFAGVHALVVDEETNRKIRRKIDWHMLPIMGFLYMLQYLDKTTLSYASSMNLKSDININSAQYSWYVF
jgi:ACS family allantoate permease-like MFS transporter